NIRSSMDDGLAVVVIEFDYSEDPDEKYQELIREMDAVKGELPEGIFRTEIYRFSPTDVNIVQIALVSETASDKEIGEYADQLRKDLTKVKDLKNVEDWGYPEGMVRILLDVEKMAQQH